MGPRVVVLWKENRWFQLSSILWWLHLLCFTYDHKQMSVTLLARFWVCLSACLLLPLLVVKSKGKITGSCVVGHLPRECKVLSRLRRQAEEHGCLYIISEVANNTKWFKNTKQSEDFTIRCAGQSFQCNEGKSGNVLHRAWWHNPHWQRF